MIMLNILTLNKNQYLFAIIACIIMSGTFWEGSPENFRLYFAAGSLCTLLWLFSRGNLMHLNKEFIKYAILLLLLEIFVFYFQVISLGASVNHAFSYLFYNIVLLTFAYKGVKNQTDILYPIIKVIAIVSTLSVILITGGAYGAMWRSQTLLDKGYMTLWYGLTLCICYMEIIANREIKLNIFLMALITISNLYLVQSKTAFLSFIVFVFVHFICCNKQQRETIYKYSFLVIIILASTGFGAIIEVLPLEIRIAINQFWGNNVLDVSDATVKDYSTYTSREAIDAFSYTIFTENPFFGIGVGNYSYTGKDILECENTYFDLLTQFGIIGSLPIFLILSYTTVKCFYYAKKYPSIPYYINILAIIIPIIVCFRWNDFLSMYVFMMIGICFNDIQWHAKALQNNKLLKPSKQ